MTMKTKHIRKETLFNLSICAGEKNRFKKNIQCEIYNYHIDMLEVEVK